MKRKLILLPGMTPDRRIYQKLVPLLEMDHVIVDWIPTGRARTIREYAGMLADTMEAHRGCDIAGVSFGGMVAQELAILLESRLCFVISSVLSSSELGPLQRWQGRFLPGSLNMALLKTWGTAANSPTTGVPRGTAPAARRYGGGDGPWFRWATAAAARWQPTPTSHARVIRIHGTRDLTFPHGHFQADHVVEGAGHMLALTHGQELADIIHCEQKKMETATPPE